jgi:DNA-binding MarR family transcriptional regulator
MNELDDFFEAHRDIEFLRRQNIADYWDEKQSDDLIRKFSLRQINYLSTIYRHGPCSLQTIMHHTGLSSSAVSAAIDKLVRAKVVNRVQNESNRREVLVSLTSAIRRHLNAIDMRFRKKIAGMLADCPPDELSAIARSSAIIRKKLEKQQ